MAYKLKTGSGFSGVGAFDQALASANIEQDKQFACDMDKFSRQTYIENYGTEEDKLILKTKDCIFIDDVYYREYNSDKKKPTPADWSKVYEMEERVARSFSFYFPWNVYSREIPQEPLDQYMTSPPCQAFSMAGKRKGEEDKRGVLFYNSHEFIQVNKPKSFIFENVKGLISDDKANKKDDMGRTFRRWLDLLGGKSVNGNEIIFPHPESVPYHIYWTVLNAKDYEIPQNRERVFIIGIRHDQVNHYKFPPPVELKQRLRDILEENVDSKFFLSDEMLEGFFKHAERHSSAGNGFGFELIDKDDVARAVTNPAKMRQSDNYIKDNYGIIKSGQITKDGMLESSGRVYDIDGLAPTITAKQGGGHEPYIEVSAGRIIGRNPDNPKSRKPGEKTQQMLELNDNTGITNTLTTVEKDNVLLVKSNTKIGYEELKEGDSFNYGYPNSDTRRGRVGHQVAQTIDTGVIQGVYIDYRIRRLTPRECFRLMGFPDDFIWPVSDSQAYKQAGNSIVMHVLKAVILKLPFIKDFTKE